MKHMQQLIIELEAVKEYHLKHTAYLEFLAHKAKLAWDKDGDDNTKLFHQSIKARRLRNQVYSIYDVHGEWHNSTASVTNAFLKYYEKLLCVDSQARKSVNVAFIKQGPVVTKAYKAILTTPYTRDEVKKALFSVPEDKAPGTDGFGTYFYRHLVYCGE